MECEKFLRQVCEDLAEDINSDFCESLRQHLEECEDCQVEVTAMRKAVNLYQCLDEQKVPFEIHQRLLKLLNVQDVKK